MVNQSNKTLAFSNKSSNMKREIKEDNNQLFKSAVISTYKKANNNFKTNTKYTGHNIFEYQWYQEMCESQ